MTDDFKLVRLDIFYQASKSKSYRAQVREMFTTLAVFLQEKGLTTRELLPEGAEISESFVIRRSDLTDEGLQFYRNVESKWAGAIDRGVSPSSTVILEKALQKMRKEADRDPIN